MADYTFNPQPRERAPQSAPEGTGGKPARIFNVFEPTIVLDEMSLPESPQGEEKRQRIENYASVEFPFIKINDYLLSYAEIDSFKIDSGDRLPKITLSVSFPNERFMSKDMPKDGDIISVSIRSKTDLLKSVRNDYVITGVIPIKRDTESRAHTSMTLFGELFIPGWNAYQGDASRKGTTMEILKMVARELGLGFNTNEDNTDDFQIWLITNSPEEFIEDLAERAWKDENSFFDWWVDIYYNLNFVNVQKQLLASETEIDEGALVSNVPTEYYWGLDQEDTIGAPKVFSNYQAFRTSSFYIKSWRPVNKSSKMTFDYGASMQCTFFEHNNILFENPEDQKYWSLPIDPAYDQEKVENHILLRGRATYDPSLNTDEPARANYNYADLYKTAPWLGIQYTLSNPDANNTEWTGNHHRNYMRARVHNTINKVEIEKLIVDIEVQGINLNIIRGDKIPIVLVKKDQVESKLVQQDFDSFDVLELFYSGWYYVRGFSLSWTGGGTGDILNSFSQSFSLTRREWPAPVPVNSRPNEGVATENET